MRLFPLLFFVFCFSGTIKSQVPANMVAPEDAAFNDVYANGKIPSVSGKILNVPPRELKNLVITYTLVTPFAKSQISKTVSVQTDGSFKLELDYAFPFQQIWFGVGDAFYTGLYVNKDLYLELDMKKINAANGVEYNGDGVGYKGTDGPLTLYLNNYILYKRADKLRLSAKISQLMQSDLASTGNRITDYDNLFDSIKIIQDSYIAANPSSYSWILENERLSDYYGQICISYFGKTMDDSLWKKVKQHKSYLISNSSSQLYDYMVMYLSSFPNRGDSITCKDVALLPDLNPGEKALIDSLQECEKMGAANACSPDKKKKWTQQLQPRIRELARIRTLDRGIERLDSAFSPAKADFLKLRLNTSTEVDEQNEARKHILLSMHTPWCIAVEKAEYKRANQKIDEINATLAASTRDTQMTNFGKPLMVTPFGATLFDASGMKALDFLAKLKQSFPSQAIIIDRWATWCVPCLAEMPHAKKLQDDSKDLPVIFVYLCTVNNSTKNKWKSKVVELQQPGVHFLIDEKLDADLSNYFSFQGYPGYAIINKAGNYKPGAIKRISDIENREALILLINK